MMFQYQDNNDNKHLACPSVFHHDISYNCKLIVDKYTSLHVLWFNTILNESYLNMNRFMYLRFKL